MSEEKRRLVGWLRLTRTPGVGAVIARRLVEVMGDPQAVLGASYRQLRAVDGVGPRLADALVHSPGQEAILDELEQLEKMGALPVSLEDPRYPSLLLSIHDPPPVLFVLGNQESLHGPRMMAVVGTRRASRMALREANALGRDLAAAGVTTVSGMALGVDAAAHQGSLDGQGTTVAVIATGLDVLYPSANGDLRRRILQSGCLVSEAPLGTNPSPRLFPARNRIISGLSHGVVVVEAPIDSGALITARMALEQGREVMAMPGPLDDLRSKGGHFLIRQGAQLIEGSEDLLTEMGWAPGCPPEPHRRAGGPSPGRPLSMGNGVVFAAGDEPAVAEEPLPDSSRQILQYLLDGPMTGDELARISHLTVSTLSRILLHLELAGLVERLPGNLYQKR